MLLEGKSRKEIAVFLNENDIETPSEYKLNKEKSKENTICLKKWNAETVNRILRNETYTGVLI